MKLSRNQNSNRYFARYSTRFGTGIVCAGTGGVTDVYLPSADTSPAEQGLLERGYNQAGAEAPGILAQAVAELERYFQTGDAAFTVPLDLTHLSPFQKKVAEAAASIPAGSVQTYGWLAMQSGSPGAARACGQVMASNRLPVLIPCHRIVAANGRLGGFSAGLGWKERLLDLEGAVY